MFDIGWTELLVLAVIAILIVGPKDLPRMLYSIGQAAGKMRRQADEFRRQFNESMREAGMDEVRNDMKKMSDLNPANQIRNEIESTFTDSPKPGSGQKPAGSEASPAPPGEGDLLEQSQGASEHKEGAPERTPDATQPPKPAAESAASEAPATQDEPRSEAKPVGNRNANGAAEAKDAVS